MRHGFPLVLAAVFVGLGLGLCQQVHAQEREEAEIDLELRERQIDMERMEAELAFQRQMRELELEARRVEIDRMRDPAPGSTGGGVALLLVCVAANILMAVWVYADNRRRDAGYGIWIAITVLVGFFGALVYAVIRLGDIATPRPAPPTRSSSARK